MVGLIHRMFLDWVEVRAGPAIVSEVKRRANVPPDKEFRLNRVYDDGEFRRLFGAACAVLGLPQARAEEALAAFCFQDLLRRWPTFFQISRNARELLERQPAIHNSFATGALSPPERQGIADKFRLESFENEIVTHYCSVNRLCGFYVALAREIIRHYQEQATVEECRCLKNGDAECEIHIRWP